MDYGVLTAPGTQGYFGVSIDGFVVPKVPKERGERSALGLHGQRPRGPGCVQCGQKEHFSYVDTPWDIYDP